jgi:phage FluMu protein Com
VNWGYDEAMFALQKGDCEHCNRSFHYTLLHAGFGDYSYAYCDSCGALATFSYSNSFLINMPPISAPHQVIDRAWEPYLSLCPCGGHFRAAAAPRCLFCNSVLSAQQAATYIERNTKGAPRGWRWQGNWTDVYCMAIEDPRVPGTLRQINDAFLETYQPKPRKGHWFQIPTFNR